MNSKIVLAVLVLSGLHASSMAMDQPIKVQLKSLKTTKRAEITQHRKDCDFCKHFLLCHNEFLIDKKFERQRTELILNAGDLVSSREKLNNAWGEQYFPQRREIIKKMIHEGENPNNITYQGNTTPLSDAMLHKDEEFVSFLQEYGMTHK